MVKKRGYWLLLFAAVFLSTSGCYSSILRLTNAVPETLPAGWSHERGHRYGFKYKDVSVWLYPSCRPDLRVVWLGPPLIPFIPRFLFASKQIMGEIDFLIQIESPTDTSGLEISEIQVWGAEEKPVRVNAKSVYLRFGSEKSEFLKEIPRQPMVSKGQLNISLECPSTLAELERFTIDLGNINVGGEKIKLPPLRLRRKWEYIYHPISNDMHWEDHYPHGESQQQK